MSRGDVLARQLVNRKRGTRLLSWLFWVAALLLLVAVLRFVPLADAWTVLRGLRLEAIIILVFMNGLVLMALNGRWWLILRGQGYAVPFFTLLGYRQVAFAVTYFTPGPQFGGEPAQVLMLNRKQDVPSTTAVAAVALDKSLELLVNFSFLAAGILILLRQQLLDESLGMEAIMLSLLLLSLPLAFLLATWAGWHPVTRILHLIARLNWLSANGRWTVAYKRLANALSESEAQATRFFQRSPGIMLLALLVSLLAWLLLVAEYWLMLSFLGLSLTAVQMIILLTAARLAILLPLPGGLGTLEASQVLALNLMGLNPAAGLSAALLIRARDVLLGGIGAWWGGRLWRQGS